MTAILEHLKAWGELIQSSLKAINRALALIKQIRIK